MPFVGLTGGIGAGKSTALAALERLGAAVLSSDDVVHEIYGSPEVLRLVTERWGEEVAPGGEVDRARIAERAFSSEEERRWLEGMIWPLVGQRIVAWREEVEARRPRPRAAIVEVPLLYEAGMEGAFDAVIAVTSDEEIRRRRASERGHVALDERASRQISQLEKARRATHVVTNDGSVGELERGLSTVLDILAS